MRSGEKDRLGSSDVGVAGLMAMTASNIGGVGSSVGGGNPGTTQLPITSKPNAALDGAPVYAIPDGAPRADSTPNPFSFPNALMIDLTDPTTLQPLTGAPSRFAVTNASGGPSAAIFDVTVRFHDLTPADKDNLDE
jgi:hypothetical protein